uniref:Uncharacterized protein isoform X1 n=1 Tax=Nicotiana tabacum TaxID=4097 RepID=A0A1S4AS55_TOBAC|nr:PREDICTED: uncharacterized protein LOC107800794 isoform X1 [Nicotiana tabacum]
MMRTRLLWFTIGLTSVSATMTHFIFKDLWADRFSLSSQLKEKCSVLETRVSSLEVLRGSPNPQQVLDPLCNH